MLTPLVFDLEFEGHAVGMWRPRKLESCRLPYGKEITIVGRAQSTSVTDGQTDRQVYDD